MGTQRDFDLLGYKYSLLSSIGTAGLNHVLCMIPARDPSEFALFPEADKAWIRHWLQWTDTHNQTLARQMPIPNLPRPQVGAVDGTVAMGEGDELGFIFLFNPGMVPLNASLRVDESLGIANASVGAAWTVTEIHPRPHTTDVWEHGEAVRVPVPPSAARVLQLSKRSSAMDRAVVRGIRFNARCRERHPPTVQQNAPIGPLPPPGNTGGAFDLPFTIASAVYDQLDARQQAYPIRWTAAERNATWLIPSRLLAYIFFARPVDHWPINASVDGLTIPVQRSYNSRGLARPRCFLGFYLDLSAANVTPDERHVLHLHLPRLSPGAFAGVFLDNVETELKASDESCMPRQ